VYRERGQRGQRQVDPEHPPPPHEGGETRAVQRAQDAAQLLCRTQRPEGHGPAAGAEQVTGQRHRDGKQCPTGQALQPAAGDQPGQRARRGRQRRTGRETHQAGVAERAAAVPVGKAAEQRHARHVTEQVTGDQRGGPFQPVDRDREVADDLDQQGDHHVRVERGEQDDRAPGADGEAASCGGSLGDPRAAVGSRVRGH
jgi:hypothetical protein